VIKRDKGEKGTLAIVLYSCRAGAAATVTCRVPRLSARHCMVIHCVSSSGSLVCDGDVVPLSDYGRQRGTRKKRGHEGCVATPRLAIVLYSRRTGVAATVTAVFRGSRLGLGMIIHCVSYARSPICDGDAVALPELLIYHRNLTSFELQNQISSATKRNKEEKGTRGMHGCV
jgi:hypothetical protein